MADIRRIVPQNVPGEFFIDDSCIDCGTCQQLAPEVFREGDELPYVYAQPATPELQRKALHALLSCPTGSIGTRSPNEAREIMHDFPLQLEANVYYCGFNSPKSYGGNSYFVQHPEGNWLIDSPKFLPHLVKRFDEMGGLRYIFLTHRDDVADADKYAGAFNSERVIHRADLRSQPDAEIVLDGTEPHAVTPDMLIIPTPGHTRGHCVLLYANKYLFTGDHLGWDAANERFGANRAFNWYSWPEQVESMERLRQHRFEWVLPGHGGRIRLPQARMAKEMAKLMDRMRQAVA